MATRWSDEYLFRPLPVCGNSVDVAPGRHEKALPTLEAATLAEPNVEQEESLQTTPFLFALPLTQNRRLRSEQIHYFDHPNMGLVLQIRKMVQPDELEEVDGERVIPLTK